MPASGEIFEIGRFYGTGHGFTSQIWLAYSAIVRSLENLPERGHVQNGLARPRVRVRIQLAQPLVRFEVGLQVRQVHVVVPMRQQRVVQRREDAWLIAAEIIGEDQVQRGAGFRLVFVVPVRVVPAAAAGHLLRRQAEQEEILLARLLRHLDGGAVARADRQGAVHHELHVARAAGLVTGGRDLVGDIAGGDQPLGERDVVLGQEQDLEPAAHQRVAVDVSRQGC